MLLVIIVAIYALVKGNVRITRRVALAGPAAQAFGVGLLVLLWPARWVFSRIVFGLLPHQWWSSRINLAIANVTFLAMFVLCVGFVCLKAFPRPPEQQAPPPADPAAPAA